MTVLQHPIKSHSVETFFGIEESSLSVSIIESVVTDSRQATEQSIFFALPGVSSNGWQYLEQVVALGCRVVVVPQHIEMNKDLNVDVIVVEDILVSLGVFLRAFGRSYPSSIIAVTGTNGKSSISYYSAQLAEAMGVKSGIVGTFGIGTLDDLQVAEQTTPDVLSLHATVMQQHEIGVESLTFEASSHALDQRRIEGLPIRTAVFSNLSRDHLDYHGTMEAYAEAKSVLFQHKGLQRAIVFLDDPYSSFMLKKIPCPVYSYSLQNDDADFYASELSFSASGVHFTLRTPLGTEFTYLPLLGEFNVANALAALAANWDDFDNKKALIKALQSLRGAPGRMQQIYIDNHPLAVVDYSHTPDALIVALQALHQHAKGRLFCVYGCGGDRDKGKRPLMTNAALKYADVAYLTSDNPRTELPSSIMSDAIEGVDDVNSSLAEGALFMIEDRRQAIVTAIKDAQVGDVVLIAGKGHENYQEINGVKHHFDDVEEARKVLRSC